MSDLDIKSGERLKISYIKTSAFREIACDGVLGGPTPQGKVWLSFYTERMPIPKTVEHTLEVNEEGVARLSEKPTILDSREGIIRNVEFGVFMNRSVAEQLRDWLSRQLASMAENPK